VYTVVDIFDGKAGTWRTAQLSVARCYLGATSLPFQGLALFAGGLIPGVFVAEMTLLDIIICVWRI
jgi:hypothetical protein